MSQLDASFAGSGRPDNDTKVFDQSNDMNLLDDGNNNILGDVYGNGLDTMNAAQSGFNFDETDDFLKSISGVLGNKPDLANVNLNNVNYNNSILSPSSINGEEAGFPEYLGAYPDQPQATFQDGSFEQPLYGTRIRSHSSSIATYNGETISPLSNHTNETSDYTSPESIQNHAAEKPTRKQTKRSSTSKVAKPKNTKDKSSHNMIEKKYRTNINSKILLLRDAVPALRIAAGAADISLADLEGITPASKLNKASVLTKATEYIKHLEQKNAILKDQNDYLQKVLQEANLSPQIQMPLAQRQMSSSPYDGSQQMYGNMRPNSSQSYDEPAYMQNQQVQPSPPQQQPTAAGAPPPHPPSQSQQEISNKPNRYLLGGMATVMATSLFGGSGENDFRSLSALPFSSYLFPSAFLNPSPVMIQLWTLTKLLLVLGSLFSVFYPMVQSFVNKPNGKEVRVTSESSTLLDCLFVSLYMKVPKKLSEQRRTRVIANLRGGNNWNQLIWDYVELSSCESNFENTFLMLLIGTLLKNKFERLSPVLNHFLSMKGGLIMNLDYRGSSKALIRLSQLIGKIDGPSMFTSETLMKRLSNVVTGKYINSGVEDGQDAKYIEAYRHTVGDYYNLVVQWRIIDIIHALNLSYLENLNEDTTQVLTDLKIVESIIDKKSPIWPQFQLLVTIVDPNQSLTFVQSLKDKVEYQVNKFKSDCKELEEDSDGEEEEELSSELDFESIVKSLSLVSQEEVIVLLSSLVTYYHNLDDSDKEAEILRHLRIPNRKFSLLTFTALVSMLNAIIPGPVDDFEGTSEILISVRKWLKEGCLQRNKLGSQSVDLGEKLAELLLRKGKIINGICVEDGDEE
ncbi:CPH2 [Candida margitis]|uniref:CPH2 n=1 Tax=Candida margitis TaxID=1775924 RepID=UPI0022270D01|nr:CPH2 [Candida margitis]KAI5968536.1 CPH2 [Candida margitis]